MSSIFAVTFDVTGTLIHCPRLGEIYSEVLDRHGIGARAEDIRRLFPLVWKELDCATPSGVDRFTRHPDGPRGWWGRLLERLCEHLQTPSPSRFAASELFNRFAERDAWEIYDDVLPALERLRDADYRLAVVSNWDDRLPALLEALGLGRFFDWVVFSSDLGIAKPNPDLFRFALSQLEVEPHTALHIGDSALEDVEGALAAGMDALLLQRGQACGLTTLEAAATEVERKGRLQTA